MTTLTSNHPAHPALRLTPSNSPFARNTSPRSPTRRNTDDTGLQLRKVIGTTTSSANAFDALPSAKCFAYAAGAAAVVATVNDELEVTQRFFRARPAQQPTGREGVNGYTGSPSPLEPRHKAIGAIRQSNVGSPLSNSVNGRDWSDSPGGKSGTAKDRVKAATSVALSPNAKWLAVGETGYKPRVLLFSLDESSSETPVTAMCEHMYGVHCLRFSPDSRYLASLGTVNDGFLYIWSVNDRTGALDLYASNKLTTLVNCIAWAGTSLITVGLRFVKVWRPDEVSAAEVKTGESTPTALTPRMKNDHLRVSDFGKSVFSPRHKTLQGKNSLLEDLLDCNFIAILPVADDQAIVCAESGEVCILEDIGKTQQLRFTGAVSFTISAARLDRERQRLLIYGIAGQHRVLVVDRLERELAGTMSRQSRRTTIMPSRPVSDPANVVTSTALLDGGIIVELSLGRAVKLRRADDNGGAIRSRQLPAHMDAILGVAAFSSAVLPDARFLTFSGSGSILFWDGDGELVESITVSVSVASDYVNEIRAVKASCCGEYLIVGDKLGLMMLVSIASKSTVRQVRAHAAEILDISTATVLNAELVATAGRDRVVQLFTKQGDKLTLLQTLDEHAGAVSGVHIDQAGQRLISCSNDRTVVIREALLRDDQASSPVAFSIERTIALKSSPTAMAFSSNDQLLLAATDRCIARYNLSDGQCAQTFKCSDDDGGDAVVASKLVHLPSVRGTACIAAACSADKSVRLYTEYGALLARDWGHTEGITDIATYSTASDLECFRLVSVAADSTMFIWDTTSARQKRPSFTNGTDDCAELPADIRLDAPMRRVISSTELALFSRKKSNTDDSKSSSPTSTVSTLRPLSPHRLRKKTSRSTISQPPKLEPTTDKYRRSSTYQRSPSPPSPRSQNRKRESMRRRSMATLRTKSSETVLRETPPLPAPTQAASGFGTLTASSESMCRTLRMYRKKLATSPDTTIVPDSLRELEKELKLTVQAIAERSAGKRQALDEASMNKLLDQASEKLVEMLDGRIKERLESEMSRHGSEGVNSLASSTFLGSSLGGDLNRGSIAEEDDDSIAGALQAVSLNEKPSPGS